MKVLIAIVIFNAALALASNLKDFAKSNKEFTANIYKELAQKNSGNFLGSPISAEIVLSMVHAGAKKQTAEQLAKGLSFPDDVSKIKLMMKAITTELKSEPDVNVLRTVNKMYVSDNLKISQDYKTTVADVFKSAVESVDFTKTDETVAKVNEWVSKNTENHIKELLAKGDVDQNTKAILLNAIYFRASWSKKFYDLNTKKSKFYTNKIGEIDVDMMETTNTYDFHKCGYFKAKFLKMPYLGKDLSMVVILPDEKDGLAHIEANIYEALDNQKYDWKKVHVKFPKFKMDATISFIPILEKLGIIDLFQENADLSGITSDGTPLHVSNVIQKSYIEVNENGTVATSATAALVALTSSYNPELPVEFTADHPFIYYIESPAGILFVGRYSGHQE
ncbi:hypothetical protein FQR65_LT07304 [Abscondita terminalis]|nr:hypothetical protein FQR65_LT07304 [Abscondita terminalis]